MVFSEKNMNDKNFKKILVVDDDPYFLRMLKDFLQMQNFDVEIAEDGKVGFNKAMTGDYDIVTMDIQMPLLNGVDSLRSIQIVNPDQKIFVISGFITTELENEIRDTGVETIITKPINLTNFLNQIKEELEI